MRGEDLPRANEAEAALLGACLLSDDAVRVALDIVTVSDFYSLKHQQIFTAVLKARDTGLVDVVTVGEHYDGVQYLHELQNAAPSISGAGRYAEQVADAARRRRLILASSEIQKSAMQASSAEEAIDSSKAALDAIEYARTDVEMPKGVLDFQQQYIHQPYDWLIPNVLEREDRMMVTGFEGMGKSTFVRQLAFQAACGVHPFSWEPSPPVQALIVDCENHPRQVSREIDVLTRAHHIEEQELLRIESRRGGINLLSPADRRWLLNLVAVSEAELLCIGPLYKMFRGSASKSDFGGEEQARQITEVLEDVRTRCGCAVILEAHAPKGSGPFGRDLAPRGSGVWMGWPEFGLGMRPEGDEADDYLLERWRGDRDAQRKIPKMVRRNASKWPWTPQFLNV